VISFARGAAPELIVHGKTGFLVHDVKEMVRYIPRIDTINRQVTRMHVEHHFSARVMAEQYVKIYKKLIAQSKPASVRKDSQVAGQSQVIQPSSMVAKTALPVQLPHQLMPPLITNIEAEPGL
jgi:hypothetical protein